jgi:DNA-binding transcriptional LysR family regulator
MELRHLRYFVVVAEAENVSRAALKLHVSQPALSRQIRDLEDELGFPLFERSAKSVHLTAAGRTFLAESRAVLQRAEEAIAAARTVSLGSRGELHVGYSPSPTVRILPPTLRAFQESTPNVRVRLHDLSTEEMLTGLREGILQLAIMVQPSRSMLRGLQFEELARDPMRLAVAPNHPFARLRSVRLAQALEQAFVIYTRKHYPEYFESLLALFEGFRGKPRIAEEHDSAASLITAVEAGCGVALVAQSMACSAGQRLKFIPLTPEPPPLVLGGAWVEGQLGPIAQQFLNAARIASEASQTPAKGRLR